MRFLWVHGFASGPSSSKGRFARDRLHERGAQTDQRRAVGRRDDDNGALEAFRTEVVFEEAADLTAAFADQRDDGHVRFRALGHHPEQRALADPAPSEHPDALPLSAGEEGIDRAKVFWRARRTGTVETGA